MRTICQIATFLNLSAPAWVPVANAQTAQPAASTPPPAATTAPPVVVEQADRMLRQVGEYVGSADEFTFHADITFDHVLRSGQKRQYSASEDVALQGSGAIQAAPSRGPRYNVICNGIIQLNQ